MDKIPGGVKTPGSGRIWSFKRDGRIGEFLVECRTNESANVKSYRISYDEFLQIEREALQTPPGFLAAMQIDIRELRLMVVRLDHFVQMQQRILELEAEVEAFREQADR